MACGVVRPWRGAVLIVLGGASTIALSAALGAENRAVTGRPAAPNSAPGKPARPASVVIRDVPHVMQKPDFCGEACAAMWLQKLGRAADQDYVFDQSGLDPREARGCHTRELAVALRRIGFQTGPVWYSVPAQQRPERLEAQWRALHADLCAGIASIVCMRYDASPKAAEHFRLVLGYDAARDEVLYHDPALADGAYRRIERPSFLALWPLQYDPNAATLIRLRLEPGQLPAAAAAAGTFTPADYAQHMMRLKRRLPAEGFTVVVQPPFIVVGDESPEAVRSRAARTVKWAVDKLKSAYFTQDPAEILEIWLLKDRDSYLKHCKSIFRHEPNTPYGFFSHTDGALVMNIATGGGTLVHEIVHPFVAANFPECPAWFNEGLASLYEQSDESRRQESRGQIVGLTNWRLKGLQDAIRAGRTPPFRDICSTTTRGFYEKDKGTNYAQARYLCYYLQEQGLLIRFYHRFRANRQKDPTGYQTLQEVLGQKDMDAFQRQWEAFVLKLRFP